MYHKAHLFGAQIEGQMNLQESDFILYGDKMSDVVDTPIGKVAPMVVSFLQFSSKLRVMFHVTHAQLYQRKTVGRRSQQVVLARMP